MRELDVIFRSVLEICDRLRIAVCYCAGARPRKLHRGSPRQDYCTSFGSRCSDVVFTPLGLGLWQVNPKRVQKRSTGRCVVQAISAAEGIARASGLKAEMQKRAVVKSRTAEEIVSDFMP